MKIHNQGDPIGQFLKAKVAQIFGIFWGNFEQSSLFINLTVHFFGELLGEWATFYRYHFIVTRIIKLFYSNRCAAPTSSLAKQLPASIVS